MPIAFAVEERAASTAEVACVGSRKKLCLAAAQMNLSRCFRF